MHVEAGPKIGLTEAETVDTVMPMAVSMDFLASLNELFVAKEVFAARGDMVRLEA